jgi:hypothetical protein
MSAPKGSEPERIPKRFDWFYLRTKKAVFTAGLSAGALAIDFFQHRHQGFWKSKRFRICKGLKGKGF